MQLWNVVNLWEEIATQLLLIWRLVTADNIFFLCRYIFAKTTTTGLTTFYALFLNSLERTATFEYRPEGLDEGSRSLVLQDVSVTDGLHHIAISVYEDSVALYLDGRLHRARMPLLRVLEDGPGTVVIGRRLGSITRFQGRQNLNSYLLWQNLIIKTHIYCQFSSSFQNQRLRMLSDINIILHVFSSYR